VPSPSQPVSLYFRHNIWLFVWIRYFRICLWSPCPIFTHCSEKFSQHFTFQYP
jgi:hypothetical protein